MTIEKLPSGSYRISQMHKGKRYRITLDHKPSSKEATILLAQAFDNVPVAPQNAHRGTLREYSIKYVDGCRKRELSPTTINGYGSIIRNTPSIYLDMNFFDIEEKHMQKMVKDYSKNHAAKSTYNLNGFYKAVFGEFRPDFHYSIKLPNKEKKAVYEPSTKDVERILEYAKGSRYSIPLQLAVLGLRRGEICALSLEDLTDDDILVINKDKVVDEHNNQVLKDSPKTSASNRRILIPAQLADEIRETGCIFDGNMHTINEHLHKIQDRLGIPRFRLHMLRHFAAAYLHKLGYSDQQILTYGGWEDGSDVMARVYRYNLDPEESQKGIAQSFGNLL